MKSLKNIRNRFTLPAWVPVLVLPVLDELMLHIWSNPSPTSKNLTVVLLLALAFGSAMSFLVSLLPAKAGKWAAVLITLTMAVLTITEYLINDYFQNFMPFSMMVAGAGGVVGTFMNVVFELIITHIPHILLLVGPILAYILLAGPRKSHLIQRIILIAGAVAVYVAAFLVINAIPGYAAGFNATYSFDSAMRSFGLNVAMPLDVIQGSTDLGNQTDFEVPVIETTAPTVPSVTESTEGTEETAEATEPPVVYYPHTYDLDFAALAESETKADIASLHAYIASQPAAMENEYTGLFEGKNLILITAEAFSKQVIDPELTPTLYRMVTEGIQFTNYYQPVWGAGTTGGEFTNVVGLSPSGGECMMEAKQQDLFLTMGNQLQALGYVSAAYHNNDYDYYSRHQTHELLGYDKYLGFGNGLEEIITKQWPESDEEMFRGTIPEWIESGKPFSLYYMTVSGHSNYGYGCNAMSRKHWDKLPDWKGSDSVKGYITANLELEVSMEYLLGALEEAGIADDTVIVIAPDHYPYGLEYHFQAELYGTNDVNRFVRDNNALIIWSGCLEGQNIVVDDPVYSLDILPTLSNLFGVDYDSRLLPGRDVFSETAPLVFWHDYSWITDKGVYNSSTYTFTPNEGVEVEEGYVDTIAAMVRNKIKYSRAVQYNDYFDVIAQLLAENVG